MGALFVPLIIVAIFVVALVVAMVSMSRRRQQVQQHVERPEVPVVRHHVAPGEDPAAVVAALAAAGFESVEYATSDEVVVPYESDADRQRIEQVIREAPGGIPGQ